MKTRKDDILYLLQNKFLYTIFCVFVVGIIAHGYAFFNMLYNTDSMLIYQDDDEWMFGLGRFLMPVYEKIRGRYYPPSVVGFLSLIFISVSAYLILKMFEENDYIIIFFVCMIFTTNFLVRDLFEEFMHDADAYMLSLMLSVIGVYLWNKYKYGFVGSYLCFVCSIGLYQAYLQVAVTLFILLAMLSLYRGEAYKEVGKRFTYQMLLMIFSIVSYYIIARIAQVRYGATDNNNMNSIGAAFKFDSPSDIVVLIVKMYRDVFVSIFDQGGNLNLLKMVAIVVVLITAATIAILSLHKSSIPKANKIVAIFLALILPGGMECVYLMSNGYFHGLMRFPMYIVFATCIIIIFRYFKGIIGYPIKTNYKEDILKTVFVILKERILVIFSILLFFIFVDNVVCAGNQYLQKDIVWQTTMFNMTRIIDRLEQTEGYEPGAPVVFVGDIEKASFSWERPDFYKIKGPHFHYSICYYRLYERYFQKLLGYPIWILSRDDAIEMETLSEVEEMPSFPHDGCIKEVNGVFVIKVSSVKLEIYGQTEEQ